MNWESTFESSGVYCFLLMNPQDVIMEYSCGRSNNLLKADDFGLEFQDVFWQLARLAPLMRHMYWIFQFIQSLPDWLAVLLSPSLGLVLQVRQVRPSHSIFTQEGHKY